VKQKLIFLMALCATLSAFSAEYFVDASRLDDTGSATNWTTAKKTIQAAVDLTVDGDTVWVTNGTYVLSAEISVTNAITVQSVNGPDATIIDGNSSNRCFLLHDTACLIYGFTITNGWLLRSPTSGNELQWQGVSGRVYAVYYSTNLISGFQPLETNILWRAGCFTDAVHNASGQLFYKLDVCLEDSGNPFDSGGGGGDDDLPATGI
jgi:hypothetical protein